MNVDTVAWKMVNSKHDFATGRHCSLPLLPYEIWKPISKEGWFLHDIGGTVLLTKGIGELGVPVVISRWEASLPNHAIEQFLRHVFSHILSPSRMLCFFMSHSAADHFPLLDHEALLSFSNVNCETYRKMCILGRTKGRASRLS